MKLEYLPNRAPFTFCGEGDVASIKNTGSPAGISNSDLLALIKSRTSFYDHYIRLTNKAIEQHVKAGRRKFALKLHGCLAALEAYVLLGHLMCGTQLIPGVASEGGTDQLCKRTRLYQRIITQISGAT
jgi:hypothetical protein